MRFILVAAVLTLGGCQAGGAGEANVEPVIVSKEDASRLASDGTTFGCALYKTVAAESEAGENLFLSPWSVHAALGMHGGRACPHIVSSSWVTHPCQENGRGHDE